MRSNPSDSARFNTRLDAARSPESQPLDSALKRHGPHQSDHAEQVVGVHVGEEDVLERERHAVSHHLSLRALAAVEHQRLALSVNRERRHVALDGWARRGRTEETNIERHGVNIAGAWNRFCDDLRIHASNTALRGTTVILMRPACSEGERRTCFKCQRP